MINDDYDAVVIADNGAQNDNNDGANYGKEHLILRFLVRQWCEYGIFELAWVDVYGMMSTGQVSLTIVMSMSTRSPWTNLVRSKMFLRWWRKLIVRVVTDRRWIRYCSCNYRNYRILIDVEIRACLDLHRCRRWLSCHAIRH